MNRALKQAKVKKLKIKRKRKRSTLIFTWVFPPLASCTLLREREAALGKHEKNDENKFEAP